MPLLFKKKSLTASNLAACILAGGGSNRMKQDKAFLNYNGKAQCEYTADLTLNLGLPTYISCQEDQASKINQEYLTIIDSMEPCGPMGGIISAMQAYPKYSKWLVLGCDYPLLLEEDIKNLITASNPDSNLAYFHEYFIPTLAVYERSALDIMLKFHQKRNFKMQHILHELKAIKLIPKNTERLKSFDTPEDYKTLQL